MFEEVMDLDPTKRIKNTDIEDIDTWDSAETTVKDIDFELVTMLEPTPKNMHRLMLKINELVEEINKLKQ